MSQRKHFLLRLDPRLYDALERWAADELRSVNAQIELLLRDRARQAGRLPERPDRGSPGEGSVAPSGDDPASAPVRESRQADERPGEQR